MTALEQRRRRLRALYGFDFPEDFFLFWESATRRRPLEPLAAVADATDAHLVGPFEVLAGRFEGRTPRYSQLLHWRYYDDPPEFFTVLAGGGDGLHWGYYLDDPVRGEGCVACYYAQDVYELSMEGNTLFEAVRAYLEDSYASSHLDFNYGLEDVTFHHAACQALDALREQLRQFTGEEGGGVGDEYDSSAPKVI